MANPQKENGYVAVSTEVFDALIRIRIPGEARQVLDYIIRMTWGWNKKEDRIAYSQIYLATGLRDGQITRAIRKLEAMNLVIRKECRQGKIYRFNKDFDTWKRLSKQVARGSVIQRGCSYLSEVSAVNLSEKSAKPLSEVSDTKDNKTIIKTIIKARGTTAKDFFGSIDLQGKTIQWLIAKGMSETFAKVELAKFIAYWTEPNAKGKMRYESEKFFEIKRRLATWFGRANAPYRSSRTGPRREVSAE